MKRTSVITSLVLLGTLFFVVFGAFLLWFSARTFENEITRLNRRDYTERIRNIEFEYQAVDAVSMASDEVWQAQEELLERLHERYIRAGDAAEADSGSDAAEAAPEAAAAAQTAYPFIVNGEQEVILYVEGSPVSREFFSSEAAARIIEEQSGTFSFERDGRDLWMVFSYFEPWDWITGYVARDAARLASLRSFLTSLLIAIAVGIAAMALLFWAYVRRALSPLARMSAAMDDLAEGNLTQRLAVSGANEMSSISARFNDFAERLSSIIETIRGAAEENRATGDRLQEHSEQSLEATRAISEQASEMENAASGLNELVERSGARMEEVTHQVTELGESIDEQFASVTESTAAAEQMSASLDNVARITREKTETSQRLKETVRDGGEKLESTREIIEDVNGRIDDISNLVSIIQNVAAQTNLLSMNAAIEAAHAGEAGKGFAVVAGEIRKLAEESSENSKNISEIIGAVIERIRSITDSSAETGKAFESIEQEVGAVLESFGEISHSADELATGSQQIRTSMGQLKDVSTKVKEGSSESLEAAKEITGALAEISERASQILKGISSVNEQSEQSVEAVKRITEEVEALRESVASLNRSIRGFEV